MRILFAEDDDILRTITAERLTRAGFEVVAVADGELAINSLKQNTYDLVLLDLRMPNKSGIDVLEFMKAENIRTHIIIASAIADREVAIQTRKLGADEFLVKPFTIDDLVVSINKALLK